MQQRPLICSLLLSRDASNGSGIPHHLRSRIHNSIVTIILILSLKQQCTFSTRLPGVGATTSEDLHCVNFGSLVHFLLAASVLENLTK